MKPRSPVPAVTLILIAANMAAAFTLLLNPDLVYDLGFQPDHPTIRAAVTSMFLHANVLHLLGNMVFLAAVGAAVEIATGSFRFASVYFVSGLVGVAVHYAMTHNLPNPQPFVGASGCIAGCAGYYSVRYTALRVPVAPKFAVSVLAVTLCWLALQVAGAFIRIGESEGTSYWAHLGGFVTGIVLSLLFRAPDLGQIKLGHEVLDQMNQRGPSAVKIMAERHLKAHPGDPKVLQQYADACHALGEPDDELKVLKELLQVLPEQEQVEVVERICDMGRAGSLPTVRRMRLAEQVGNSHPDLARVLLKTVIEGPDDPQRPEAMLALASLERDLSPEDAANLLAALERAYPLHPTVDLARKRGWIG